MANQRVRLESGGLPGEGTHVYLFNGDGDEAEITRLLRGFRYHIGKGGDEAARAVLEVAAGRSEIEAEAGEIEWMQLGDIPTEDLRRELASRERE